MESLFSFHADVWERHWCPQVKGSTNIKLKLMIDFLYKYKLFIYAYIMTRERAKKALRVFSFLGYFKFFFSYS